MSEELKPCPFCGGEALILSYEDGWGVQCQGQDCYCEIGVDHGYGNEPYYKLDSREEAIKAWNQRAADNQADLKEAVGMVRKVCIAECGKSEYALPCVTCEIGQYLQKKTKEGL